MINKRSNFLMKSKVFEIVIAYGVLPVAMFESSSKTTLFGPDVHLGWCNQRPQISKYFKKKLVFQVIPSLIWASISPNICNKSGYLIYFVKLWAVICSLEMNGEELVSQEAVSSRLHSVENHLILWTTFLHCVLSNGS